VDSHGSKRQERDLRMSSDIAIDAKELSKCYHIYEEPHHRLLQMVCRSRKKYYKDFWALKKLSFQVARGETVGIVGRNGSGKSTLLQLICGTLNPSSGSVSISGRISALLELGSGFNPEFSGRENVYLYASVLGLSRRETENKMSDIEAFADIGDFIERSVKSYSSGMVVRLAFAVAIHVEPQILVVDEALAVGDELFQRKCFSRIEQLKSQGVTILFVSHSSSLITALCDRVILLDRGECLLDGGSKTVVGLYQRLLYANAETQNDIRREIKAKKQRPPEEKAAGIIAPKRVEVIDNFDPSLISRSAIAYEERGAKIVDPCIVDATGKQVNCLNRGHKYTFKYEVDFKSEARDVSFGVLLKSKTGIELGGYVTANNLSSAVRQIAQGQRMTVSFPFECNFNPGTYYFNAGVRGMLGDSVDYLHRILDAVVFRVNTVELDCATGLVDIKSVPRISLSGRSKQCGNYGNG
jgi:lipopolysaccharide transport system ATP-binding protein